MQINRKDILEGHKRLKITSAHNFPFTFFFFFTTAGRRYMTCAVLHRTKKDKNVQTEKESRKHYSLCQVILVRNSCA